jgi:hypothetical protein
VIRSTRLGRCGIPIITVIVIAMAAPAPRAFALATEQRGNAPIQGGLNFGAELLTAVNLTSRVYWYEVNGNPTFFFRGDVRDLNDAMRKFAAIPAKKREIILLPGAGETTTLTREQRIPYNWSLHVPMGLRMDKDDDDVGDVRATFTIHIPAPRPAPVGRDEVQKWVAQLGGDDFKARERASKALEALGPGAALALREASKAVTTPEARERIERLLRGMSGIGLDVLEPPDGVPVVGPETLLERGRNGLKKADANLRGYAVLALVNRYADAEEVLPDLLKFLAKEEHEYPLRCTASALARLGASAKPALPMMREQLKSKDQNVVHSFQQAIEMIEKAEGTGPSEEELKKRGVIRRDIAAFVKGLQAKKEGESKPQRQQ